MPILINNNFPNKSKTLQSQLGSDKPKVIYDNIEQVWKLSNDGNIFKNIQSNIITYPPLYYINEDNTINGHLEGIDNALNPDPISGSVIGLVANEVNTIQFTNEEAQFYTGFVNQTDSIIDFNNNTRTFTIQPSNLKFSVYVKGKVFEKTTIESIQIPNVTGSYYIYYNINGNLTVNQNEYFGDYAWVSVIYWDSVAQKAIYFAEERHTIKIPSFWHFYTHHFWGTQYYDGLSFENYILNGNGNLNSHAQIGITNGKVYDEDIEVNIINSSNPVNRFEQILNPIAKIPMYYRNGTLGTFKKFEATNYPCVKGTNTLYYNEFNSNTWSLVEAGNNKFISTWVFASCDLNEPIVGLIGQRVDSSLNNARDNNKFENLELGNVRLIELKLLYRLIFETSSSMTNTVSAKLVDIHDYRGEKSIAGYNYIPSDHGNLTGLNDIDHPASAIRYNNSMSGLNSIEIQSAIDELKQQINAIKTFVNMP